MMLTGIPFGAQPQDTAEYMLGDVVVTVVLMESNGVTDPSTEDWTQNSIDAAKAKVQEGMQWWEDVLANYGPWLDDPTPAPVHSLNFILDFQFADQPVQTKYEPITRISNDYVLWVEDFLNEAGFATPATIDSDIRAFNNYQREAYGADWAFTVFVVNDDVDLDGRFESGGDFRRAFAFSGGRFLISPAGRPASTFAHETGHIFYARDEYLGSSGKYTDHRGYYNTQNVNAWDNPLPGFVQAPSVMASDSLLDQAYAADISSESSLAMVGWQDSDGDGVFDVLDVPLTLTGYGYYDPVSGLYRFQGHSSVQTHPNANSSGRQNDITINEVSVAEFSLDGGTTWEVASEYHSYEANLDLKIPVDAGDQILIRTRSIDSGTGLTVVTSNTTFEGSTDLPTFATDSGVQGYVWEDVNADGVWNAGERGIPGWNLQLVDDQGQPLQMQQTLEPDDYIDGLPIGNELDGVTLSASGYLSANDSVGAISASTASTGTSVFGYIIFGTVANWSPDWMTGIELRIDFDEPAAAISLDAVGANNEGVGRLEAYDASGSLLERYTTVGLQSGVSETMTIERSSADIAYVVAKSHMNSTIRFDNLTVGPSTEATSDKYGYYELGQLPSDTYYVKATPSDGWSISNLSSETLQVVIQADGSLLWPDGEDRPSDFIGTLDNADTPWKNPRDPLDVNDDGVVAPIDALLIINELNAVGSYDLLPPTIGNSPPPYLDTSGDNVVAALDALLVINYLNSGDSGNGESDGGFSGGGGGGAEGEADVLQESDPTMEIAAVDQPSSMHRWGDKAQLLIGLPSFRPGLLTYVSASDRHSNSDHASLEQATDMDALHELWGERAGMDRDESIRNRTRNDRESISEQDQEMSDRDCEKMAGATDPLELVTSQLWGDWERAIHLIARHVATAKTTG